MTDTDLYDTFILTSAGIIAVGCLLLGSIWILAMAGYLDDRGT